MARRSRRRIQNKASFGDPLDDLDFQTPAAGQRISLAPLARAIRQKTVVEDRRNWAPRLRAEPQRVAPRDTVGRAARLVYKTVAVKRRLGVTGNQFQPAKRLVRFAEKTVPHFAEARKAMICAKRKIRREVLFATHRTAKGTGAPKRRNEWSDVRC